MSIIIDQSFENVDFTNQKLLSKEYDSCYFLNCNFTGTDMSVVSFLECRFEECLFTGVMLKETSFQEVNFVGCKMVGTDFSYCNPFMFRSTFNSCNLELSNFSGFSIKNSKFLDCKLIKADFTNADATAVIFATCNLQDAIFERTILEKTNLRTAINFNIDPEMNNLKGALVHKQNLAGFLYKHKLNFK